MNSRIVTGVFVFIFISTATLVVRAEYAQVFDGFADGTTELGDGSIISSNNGPTKIQGNALQLTEDGVGSTLAAFKLPILNSGLANAFTATFDFALSAAGDRPADGFSFNYGAIPDDGQAGEEGYGSGLAIEFDTWDNGGEGADNGIGIDVSLDGADVALAREAAGADPKNNAFFKFDGQFRPVRIDWRSTGAGTGLIDVTVDDVSIHNEVEVNGFNPNANYRFAFGARTGGAFETLLIDNLTVTPEPSGFALALLGLFGLPLLRRGRE